MKKIFYFLLMTVAFAFTSCEYEGTTYDGSQTLAYFQGRSGNLEVEITKTNTVDVGVAVSTISASDRVLTVVVNEDDTTADASQYSFNGEVTIPANSYFGTLTVTGIDNPQLPTTGLNLVLSIGGFDGGSAGVAADFNLRIAKVCPVPETYFTGTYLIEQLTGTAPFASIEPAFGTQTVEVVNGGGTAREFDFLYSPLNFESDFKMTLNLACGEILIAGRIQSGSLSCDGGNTQIGQGNSSNPSTYDIAFAPGSDDVITLFMNDFEGPGLDGGCDEPPYEIELRMTKQ